MLPHINYMAHLCPTAQLTKLRCVQPQGHNIWPKYVIKTYMYMDYITVFTKD